MEQGMLNRKTMVVSDRACTDDVWLLPYVGYEIDVIREETGLISFILDGSTYKDMEDYLEYLDDLPNSE